LFFCPYGRHPSVRALFNYSSASGNVFIYLPHTHTLILGLIFRSSLRRANRVRTTGSTPLDARHSFTKLARFDLARSLQLTRVSVNCFVARTQHESYASVKTVFLFSFSTVSRGTHITNGRFDVLVVSSYARLGPEQSAGARDRWRAGRFGQRSKRRPSTARAPETKGDLNYLAG